MPDFKRPTLNGSYITTPKAETSLKLLGGVRQDSVAMTADEQRALEQLYGFESETNPVLQAGATRNLMRHAQADGLRVIAWLAKYCTEGQDPLKLVIELTQEAGLDVPYEDAQYAEESADE